MTTEEYYLSDAIGRTVAIKDLQHNSWEYYLSTNERDARLKPGTANGARFSEEEAQFFVYDHLGNTRITYTPVSLSSEYTQNRIDYVADYFPYGKVLREFVYDKQERYLTTQHERDQETGLDYRGARYYDSDVARFLSVDPLAHIYPSLSTYNYVAGNPIVFIDPDGKYIEYGVKGKEKRELKRAIKFQMKTDDSFRKQYEQWKEDPSVAHVLRWQQAPQKKRTERNTDSFDSPYERSNKKGDHVYHYFDKQKIEINNVVASQTLKSSGEGQGQYSETIENINISEGRVIVNYQMYSLPDVLTVYNQNNVLIASMPEAASWKGQIEGSLNNASNLMVKVNEGSPNEGSVFKLKLRIIDDSTPGEIMYTHERKALKKALKNGFTTVY